MPVSYAQELGKVTFPKYNNEKIYMVPFYQKEGLPLKYFHWQKTVDQMLEGITTDLPVYFMVDQAFTKASTSQRRPGVHVDMYWNPTMYAHGSVPSHRSSPGVHDRGVDTHRKTPGTHNNKHIGGHGVPVGKHCFSSSTREAIILASDIVGCLAYNGEYEGEPGNGGDCSHIDVSGLDKVIFRGNIAYAGHTMHMLHESVPVEKDCFRTVVRLNVPGWSP